MLTTYCYKAKDGRREEFEYPAGEAPDVVTVAWMHGKKKYHRDRQAEAAGMHVSVVGSQNCTRQTCDVWPMQPCVASGVNADQAQDLRDHLRGNGCPTEVTKDGDPIYTSASHRKKALKIRGLHDNNSFS